MNNKKTKFFAVLLSCSLLSACGPGTPSVEKFKISWKNYNGTLLDLSIDVPKGTVPIYNGETPAREADDKYTYTFSGWAPNVKEAYSDDVYTAQYTQTPKKYNVSLNSEDENKGTVAGSGIFDYDSVVTVSATPKKGYTFIGWFEDSKIVSSEETYTFDMPSHSLDYIAKFSEGYFNLNLSSNSEEGTVIGAGSFTFNSEVEIVAKPNAGYKFVGWYDGDNLISNEKTYKFTMPYNNVNYNARFEPINYTISVTIDGTDCWVNGEGTYAYKSIVSLEAKNAVGYHFVGWYSGSTLLSSEPVYTFEMPHQNINYVAKFSNKYTVSISTSCGFELYLHGEGEYSYNEQVTLSCYLQDSNSLELLGWYEGDVLKGRNWTYSFKMPDRDLEFHIEFKVNSFPLVVTTTAGGMVTEIDEDVLYGTEITIKATPNEGYYFTGWYNEKGTSISTSNPYTFTMGNSGKTLYGRFSCVYTITVKTEDYKKGTVTATDKTCAAGNKTTVTATPVFNYETLYKNAFEGWYDGNVCVSRDATYTFEMPYHDVNLVAKFHLVHKDPNELATFGRYPTVFASDSMYSKLSSYNNYLKTDNEQYPRKRFNWYMNGDTSLDYAWYLDLDLDKDGQYDYRGVYYIYYRPIIATGNTLDAPDDRNLYKYSNQQYNTVGRVSWFKYMPIEWKVLRYEDGTGLLFSNEILDAVEFNAFSGDVFDEDGNKVTKNDYQYSEIRKFLINDFYNTAFNEEEKKLILTNEIITNGFNVEKESIIRKTNDSVFLMSLDEYDEAVKVFGDQDGLIRLCPTDYADHLGERVGYNAYSRYGYWSLRDFDINHTSIDNYMVPPEDFYQPSERMYTLGTNWTAGVVPMIYVNF